MANQNYNASITFTANTAQAKQELQSLKAQISSLTTKSMINIDGSGITKATDDLIKLKTQLQLATNQDTGKLDLTKFAQGLEQSNMSLSKYRKSLMQLGPEGEKAFSSLSKAILNADAPIKRTSTMLTKLKETFVNTFRWQLSSSALHAFMGAIQSSFRYAQDLDKSLNNIRIVTGQSAEKMADFAKEANKAAKALSASTLEYTEASLIYYQQGLNEKQVKERADVTVKMANVSGQSAETVSEQMTSVWNNFYDGSKSLEYYSDVMVALGAATASSSKEIATGLEKFSAVAGTVGLSYEYAAAALATVTAQTRQSADTVGTAFRTLFTRLQGLSLGETLDDGVTLNKYSNALNAVGVSILDQRGQLKEMDSILSELGAKWNTIGKEQQVALAQTIGGARQYATLIALMDNWDFFQENLGTVGGAEGSLQEQADIYAESWQAASKRVKASMEKIYNSVLDSKVFIKFLDTIDSILKSIGNMTEAMGGFKGVLLTVGTLVTTIFSKNLVSGLNALGTSLGIIKTAITPSSLREEAVKGSDKVAGEQGTPLAEHEAKTGNLKRNVQQMYLKGHNNMNEFQQQEIKNEFDKLEKFDKLVEEKAKVVQEVEQNQEKASKTLSDLSTNGLRADQIADKYEKYKQEHSKLSGSHNASKRNALNKQFREETGIDPNDKNLIPALNNYTKATNDAKDANKEFIETQEEQEKRYAAAGEKIQQYGTRVYSTTEKMVAFAQVGMAAVTAFNTLLGVMDTLKNEDLSPWEKFKTILTSVLMVAPMIVSTLGSAIPVITGATAATTGLGVAVNTVLNPIGLLIAAVGLVTVGLVAWIATQNSITEKLKKANKQLENSRKELKELTEGYNDLKNSIDSLKSAEDTLNGLAEGTREWKEAILEINEQVLSLLDTYPELAKYITNVNGKLTISDEGLDYILENSLAKANAKTTEVLVNQRKVSKLELLDVRNNSDRNYTYTGKKRVVESNSQINNDDVYIGSDYSYGSETSYLKDVEKTISSNQLAKMFDALEASGAITSDENGITNIDFSKDVGDSLDAELKALLQNSDIQKILKEEAAHLRQFGAQVNAATEEFESFGDLFGQDWIERNNKTGSNTVDNAKALGVGNLLNDKIEEAKTKLAAESGISSDKAKDNIISSYAALSGFSIEELEQKVKDDEEYLTTMYDVLVNEKAAELANNAIDSQISSFVEEDSFQNGGYSDEVKAIIINYLRSAGDVSIIDALTDPEQIEQVRSFFNTLKEGIFGDIIDETTIGAAKDLLNSEDYATIAQQNIEKRYKASEEQLASSQGLDAHGYSEYQKELADSIPGFDKLEEYDNLIIKITEDSFLWADAGQVVGDTLNDLKDTLKDRTNEEEYWKALKKLSSAITSWTGIEIDSSIVKQLWDSGDLERALQGNLDAIITIYKESLKYQISLLPEIDGFDKEGLLGEINSFYDAVAAGNVDVGLLDSTYTGFVNTLINMKLAAGATVTEIQSLLSNMGIDAEVEVLNIDGEIVQKGGGEVLNPFTQTLEQVDKTEFITTQTGQVVMPFVKDIKFTGVNHNFKYVPKDSKGSKKSKKKASEEIERYHVVKEQLEDIEQELDRISKAKDRAFGGDKLKLMDDEIAKTQELLDKEQEYFDQINANYGPDRAILESKYGAKFDVNGALLNYDELMNAQINKFNASLSDEAEEEYKTFEDLIKKYEETDDLLAEQRQKLIDLQNELFDLMLEKLEYEVTLKIDVNEDANKYLDFLMEMNGDGMDHALDNIDALSEKIANGMEDIETYTNGLNNMFKNRGYKGNVVEDLQSGKVTPEELAEMYDLTEAEVDLLREYMGNIMDTTKEIQNMRKEITDQLIDAIEEINEKFDEQIDKINRAAEGMQHYRDIIDLVGQDALGISDEMVEMFSEKQLNNSIANVSATRTKMLENEREYNEAVAELERLKDTGASEFAIEEQERVVEAARKHLYDSTDEFNNAWKDALEQAREHFDLTVEQITSAFEEAMSGIYGNLEALQDAYDRQSEINERYLEDYEKIYELSKLNRDIGNSIDNTDNIRAKQELMKLQEEINALEESGAEISKYDLDFLRQKYELRLAEIALEEAQNAKSQVRMTRDSEGNWNYTYTANEENISKAEQNYEDALYKTQQLTTDYIKDLENKIFQLNTDLVNALSSVDPNDAEGRQRIYDYYMGQNNYLTSQLNNALGNNADIYNQDWMNYSNATGYKISDNEKWMDSFNETTLSMLTGYSSLGDYQNAFRDSSLLMYNSINDAASEFAANTETVMNAAGTSIETFAEDAEEAFKKFSISTKEATDNIDGIDKEAKETFDAILEKLVEFNKAYDEQIQQTIKANQDLIKSFNELIAKEAEAKKSSGGSSDNSSNDTSGTSISVEEPAQTKEIWYAPIKSGSEYVEGNYVYQNYIQKSSWGNTRSAGRKQVRAIVSGNKSVGAGSSGFVAGVGSMNVSVRQFDTGGYTGAWGTTAGKLAMLHEKELVLNKQDTENILQSVNLVRQISDWISGRVNAMQYGSMLSAFGLPGDNKNVLEQMVTIHAEFPNANNRAEIEAAFDNLVNRAAQYAYRK